jgi:hypothetical protein
MDVQSLFKKALKEDKLAEFIVGGGGFRYSSDIMNYGGKVRFWYYKDFAGQATGAALKERFDRIDEVTSYFAFHEEELPEGIGKRRKLVKQLLDEESQVAWDAVHRLNTLRGGIAFNNRDYLLVALEKDDLRDYVLGKNRFCTFVSQADDPQWDRGKQVAELFKSLLEGVDKQKLRAYLAEALKPDAPEKFLTHIFTPLLDIDLKLKAIVNSKTS